jgi:predicted XRE-type DNA-binding protein
MQVIGALQMRQRKISSCEQIVCEKINNFRESNINRFELDEITNATGLQMANVLCNLKKRGKKHK